MSSDQKGFQVASFASQASVTLESLPGFMLAMVVPVIVRWNATGRASPRGTAFCVANFSKGQALYVTARHVIDECVEGQGDPEPLLLLPSSEATAEHLLGVRVTQISLADTYSDVALLRVNLDSADPRPQVQPRAISLAMTQATAGEPTMALGFRHRPLNEDGTFARELRASQGRVLEVFDHQRDAALSTFPSFRTDGAYFSGMSGGPVVSSNHGGVIGIVSHGTVDDDEHGDGYAASIAGLAELRVDLVCDDDIERDLSMPEIFAASGMRIVGSGVTLARDPDGVRLTWSTSDDGGGCSSST